MHDGRKRSGRPSLGIAKTGGPGNLAFSLKHVHEIQDCDDRDRDADGPREYAFHWCAPVVVAKVKRGWGWVGSFGVGTGPRLTAGWVLLCWFWALYGATSPGDVLLEMLQKCLPEGMIRNGKQSSGGCWPGECPSTPARAGSQARGFGNDRGAVPDRRVGAAAWVLGTLWGNVSRRGSAGDAAKAPARGGGQALPGGLRP